MTRDPEDRQFRPRAGRSHTREDGVAVGKPKRFVAKVLKASNQAGVRLIKRQVAANRLARGAMAARLTQAPSRHQRRVAVKVRLLRLATSAAGSTSVHLRYIQRDAVGRTGEAGVAYDSQGTADVAGFEAAGREDRHQFRIIVAPEDGEALGDLQSYTRSFMQQVEQDLGSKLQWVSVDHHDTGHPHSHIVLRGVDDRGADLVIAGDYIGHGLRARASEIATQWLGPRSEREIADSLDRDVSADRWTALDRRLRQLAEDSGAASLDRLPEEDRIRLRGRLAHLEKLGLASRQDRSWQIAVRAEPTLRALGERGDIIRTMQRALGTTSREIALPAIGDIDGGASVTRGPIVGKIVAKGLVDEFGDQGWLAVDAADGRSHYLRLPSGAILDQWPVDGIVTQVGSERPSDRAIAGNARDGIYTIPSGNDPEARRLRDAHGRRLEALRRAGVVERIDDGRWRVPPDLAVRGANYDRPNGGGLRLQSPVGLTAQARAIGATWLDRRLVAEELGRAEPLALSGFGAEVRLACERRATWLKNEGLAHQVDGRLSLVPQLLESLRARDLEQAAALHTRQTGLAYRPVGDGRLQGTLTGAVDRPSGRFAILDDGAGGFSLVPWRPVLENRVGQSLTAIVDRGAVSWQVGRQRGIGL